MCCKNDDFVHGRVLASIGRAKARIKNPVRSDQIVNYSFEARPWAIWTGFKQFHGGNMRTTPDDGHESVRALADFDAMDGMIAEDFYGADKGLIFPQIDLEAWALPGEQIVSSERKCCYGNTVDFMLYIISGKL